jgi:hypothetical protein
MIGPDPHQIELGLDTSAMSRSILPQRRSPPAARLARRLR